MIYDTPCGDGGFEGCVSTCGLAWNKDTPRILTLRSSVLEKPREVEEADLMYPTWPESHGDQWHVVAAVQAVVARPGGIPVTRTGVRSGNFRLGGMSEMDRFVDLARLKVKDGTRR